MSGNPEHENENSWLGPRVPAGWKEFWSVSKQKHYYQHKATKQIVWEIPTGGPAPWEPEAGKGEGGAEGDRSQVSL